MTSEPILFIPDANCTGELFGPQLAAWSTKRRCVIPRHGDYPDFRVAAGAILLLAPPQFALVGLAMGGNLALEIIRQAPQRVTRLALLDAKAAPDTAEEQDERTALIALAEEGEFERVYDILWPRLVHKDRLSDEGLQAIVQRMMRDTGPEKFVVQQRAALNRMNYQATLASVSVPTLVLVGEADEITPPAHARSMVAAVKGATLVIVPDCGHLSTLEQPRAVNFAMGRWLARQAA